MSNEEFIKEAEKVLNSSSLGRNILSVADEALLELRKVTNALKASEVRIQAAAKIHFEYDRLCMGCSVESIPELGVRGLDVPWPCDTAIALGLFVWEDGKMGVITMERIQKYLQEYRKKKFK